MVGSEPLGGWGTIIVPGARAIDADGGGSVGRGGSGDCLGCEQEGTGGGSVDKFVSSSIGRGGSCADKDISNFFISSPSRRAGILIIEHCYYIIG